MPEALTLPMKQTIATQIAIGLTLFTALSNFGIYTWPFRTFGQDGFYHPAMIGTNLLSILFLVGPLLAVYFYRQKGNACYFWLASFSIPAFMFGITPIPFLHHLYSSNVQLNSMFIAIINIAFVMLCWWLYRVNKLSKWDAVTGAPS